MSRMVSDEEYNWDDHGKVITTQDIKEVRDAIRGFNGSITGEAWVLVNQCLELCVDMVRQGERNE